MGAVGDNTRVREMEVEMEIEREKLLEIEGGGASAVLNLTAGDSIPIRYHSLFGSDDDILLLELDDKLLPDLLHNR